MTPNLAELVTRDPGWLGSQQAPEGFLFKSDTRAFRIISIETEVDGDKRLFPSTLWHCGLVSVPEVMPFGWHPEGGEQRAFPGFIKHDGSVTGGELVIELLDLTKKDHAQNLQLILDRLRALEKARVIQYNPNCGGHIHVDAAGLGLYDLWRLNDAYSYIEDLVYRLAGAGKTYGHRTLFKGMERHPGGYANPVVKGPFITVHDCFGRLRTQKRMSGLNYTGYFSQRCKCGKSTYLPSAKYLEVLKSYGIAEGTADSRQVLKDHGTLDRKNCVCKVNKNTVEWRVWNSQGNPRILYAWIALMQALFAHSYEPWGTPEYETVEQRPALSYSGQELSKSDPAFVKQAQERAEWLFTELPLEPIEKDALAYAFMRSECKSWGSPFFKRLVNTPTKQPRVKDPYQPSPFLIRDILKGKDIPVKEGDLPKEASPFVDASGLSSPDASWTQNLQELLSTTPSRGFGPTTTRPSRADRGLRLDRVTSDGPPQPSDDYPPPPYPPTRSAEQRAAYLRSYNEFMARSATTRPPRES